MYKPVYNDIAFHQILGLRPSSVRRRVLSKIEEIALNPFVEGDFKIKDQTGRDNQMIILGGFAITFWADHAVKEIRIIDVSPVTK